ncbi:O-linked-mannose beta-1-4-N-acetylglucosaminyltransferase 2-like, partial [Homarus americanus]
MNCVKFILLYMVYENIGFSYYRDGTMVVISKDVNLKVVLIWAVVHSTRQVSDSCIDETARVVVGVHGAALILGMFLQPGSILVEIWPFGINSNASTVYKTMCGLQDFGVAYVPWMNKDIINTVYHPEYPAAYGGLSQLSFEEQQ